jgi:hypothetical protein
MTEEQDLATEIEALDSLDLCPLRQRWQELYGTAAPACMSQQLLVQAVAYQIQVQVYGGLGQSTRKRLTSHDGKPNGKPRRKLHRRYKPGTQFLREWQGRTHKVTATDDGGFLYRGTAYRSLSKVARAITGTHWSGPAFFGLNDLKEGADG